MIGLMAMAALGLAALVFWSPLQRGLTLQLVSRSENPDESVVYEFVDRASDPAAVLARLWRTGRIPHRTLVISYLKNRAPMDPELSRRAEALVVEATDDVDFTVRELAFGALSALNHPQLFPAARRQLLDNDPHARALGLRYLRQRKDPALVPLIVRLLDDAEPSVVTSASAVLQSWTGEDFGIRQRMAMRSLESNDVSSAEAEGKEKLAEGVRRWKEWWAAHRGEYAADPLPTPRVPPAKLPAQDFALPDPADKRVRLSEFRGKVILLNFWTTWCPACQVEIPHLSELQRRNPDRLVVLGISLDGQPEDDGHGHSHDEVTDHAAAREVRQIVSDFVSGHGIHYRVLLDPKASVACRFNGTELPTNVLIDPEGFVRRRFIGGRSVAAFEAMIGEIIGNENHKR